jgi:hypothetical protein
MALVAYRHLLRSTRIAFAGLSWLLPSQAPKLNFKGDAPLLHAAREEARNSFRKNASLLPEDPALAPAIAHAEDVAKILRENVVQGKKTEDDRYSKLLLKVEVEEMLIV